MEKPVTLTGMVGKEHVLPLRPHPSVTEDFNGLMLTATRSAFKVPIDTVYTYPKDGETLMRWTIAYIMDEQLDGLNPKQAKFYKKMLVIIQNASLNKGIGYEFFEFVVVDILEKLHEIEAIKKACELFKGYNSDPSLDNYACRIVLLEAIFYHQCIQAGQNGSITSWYVTDPRTEGKPPFRFGEIVIFHSINYDKGEVHIVDSGDDPNTPERTDIISLKSAYEMRAAYLSEQVKRPNVPDWGTSAQ